MEKQDLEERRERTPVQQAQDAFTPETESDEAAHAESDQLPEDAPEEVVEDDTGGEVRDQAEDSAGGADESDPDQATGNPDNTGS